MQQSGARGSRPTRLVSELPATMPFVAPEAIERASGRRLVLRLGANESSFGPSPQAVQAMHAEVEQVAYYGDPESHELRSALARHHHASIEHIVVGSGIDDLLGLVVRAYLDHGESAVTSLGAYPTFNYHVAGFGGALHCVPYRNDRNDLEALAAAAHETHARLIYLANPDNPTGTWHSSAALDAFMGALPADCLLLLDEAYIDFAPPDALLLMRPHDPRVLRLRTFSKAYGMAGARIGYAVGADTTVATFEKIRLHFGVNRMAQAGALAALADADFLSSVVAQVAAGRDEYASLARELGLRAIPSATNFVAMDAGTRTRAQALAAALAARDVFIRMPGAPPLDQCIRVTVGTSSERAAFATVLRAAWSATATVS